MYDELIVQQDSLRIKRHKTDDANLLKYVFFYMN